MDISGRNRITVGGTDLDQIRIRDLEIYAGHGALPMENRNGQLFILDICLHQDLAPAGKTDRLSESTHYGEVSRFADRFLRQHTYQLIETAAEQLSKELLLAFPGIREVELELKKPNAPIGLPLSCVSVKICRGWKQVYLGIGSNMGDKHRYLEEALKGLRAHPQVRNVVCSELIETVPYGGVEQEDFLNGAVELETLLTPWELLDFLHELEQRAGRERKIHWGPRTLDLDILFFQDCIVQERDLMIPHPDIENRLFVLEPLAQLCPYYIDPVSGKSVKQMLVECRKKNKIQ